MQTREGEAACQKAINPAIRISNSVRPRISKKAMKNAVCRRKKPSGAPGLPKTKFRAAAKNQDRDAITRMHKAKIERSHANDFFGCRRLGNGNCPSAVFYSVAAISLLLIGCRGTAK